MHNYCFDFRSTKKDTLSPYSLCVLSHVGMSGTLDFMEEDFKVTI